MGTLFDFIRRRKEKNKDKEPEAWDTGIEEINGHKCAKMEDADVDIIISAICHCKLCFIADEIGNKEFAVYLYGFENSEIEKEKYVYINRIYIPKQEVGYATFKIIEEPPVDIKGDKLIGILHSHVNMNLRTISGVDRESSSANHKISIVSNNSENGINYKGFVKLPLPCDNNKFLYVEKNVIVDWTRFQFDFKEKIMEKQYRVYIPNQFLVSPEHESDYSLLRFDKDD